MNTEETNLYMRVGVAEQGAYMVTGAYEI